MSSTLYSSLTKKYIMSLAGLFLLTFLFVHLTINLMVLLDDGRGLFNEAAHFMGTNIFIQTFQWVLFGGFIIHMIFGVILQIQNWLARPKGYKKKAVSEENYFSKFMIHTGILIGVFLFIHLTDFFFKKMAGTVPEIHHGDLAGMEDMGILIIQKFKGLGYVLFYVVAFLFLGFHLDHAFQSAFQSLGLNHKKYTPFIKWLSHLVAIVLTVGFIIIPITIYFFK
jgi:succinate dehydrogenase / fumarate reductase, cytochrome b subunit